MTSPDQLLWVGEKAGAAKVAAAQRLGAKVSTVADLIDMVLEAKPKAKPGQLKARS